MVKGCRRLFLGFAVLLSACQSAIPPVVQSFTPDTKPSSTSILLPTIFTPSQTPSSTPTLPPTLTPIPTPMPTSLPAAIYQNSFAVGFSTDGNILAFNSSLDRLVPDDQNHMMDPFIYQTENGVIQRISAKNEGLFRNDTASMAVSLSADGRYLLFGASSNNSVPAVDHYNFITLRDLVTGQDERIDLTPFEKQFSTPGVSAVSLSPDGRYLALEVASNHWSIYLWERSTGRIIPVSVNPDWPPYAIGDSYEPVFSLDGRYLTFVSSANNLAPGDAPCSDVNPNCGDVFVYEIGTGSLERIPAKIRFNEGEPYPYLTVSNNARWLAWTEVDFSSPSFPVIVRLFDRSTSKTETVCVGVGPSCSGHSPSISADGRWLAFSTFPATDLSGQRQPESYAQVYLLDHQTGQLTLVSADSIGAQGNGNSGMISLQQEGFSSDVRISGDGRFVAFSSQAANLLPAGVEKRQCFDPIIVGAYHCYDLFIYNRQTKMLYWLG